MTAKFSAGAPPERRDAPGGSWPPGPKGLPFLGNLLDFRRDALRYYSEWSRQYGDIVALRLGTWPAVLLNHSDYVEYVLVRNARNFIKFPFFFRHVREIFGRGLLTSEGELWHRQRRLAAPAFHAQRLAVYGDTTVRFTERMLESWRPGDLRDVHVDTTALTMCIAAKALFNAEVKKDVAEIGQAFNAIVEEIAVRLRRPFRILDAVPTPGNIRYVRAVHRIDRLVTKIIRERREQGGDRGDLLSILLLGRDEEDQSMSERQLRDEVVTLLVAGHETTAIALSWTWYLLAHSPDVDAKLAAELRDVLGGRAPTVSDLAQLRLYPAGGDRGAAHLSARMGLWQGGDRRLRDRRLCHPRGHDDHHQPLGVAPRSALLRAPDGVSSRALERRLRPATPTVRLHPVRGRASHLHRQSVCYDGDDPDPGHRGATIPIAMARQPGRSCRCPRLRSVRKAAFRSSWHRALHRAAKSVHAAR